MYVLQIVSVYVPLSPPPKCVYAYDCRLYISYLLGDDLPRLGDGNEFFLLAGCQEGQQTGPGADGACETLWEQSARQTETG